MKKKKKKTDTTKLTRHTHTRAGSEQARKKLTYRHANKSAGTLEVHLQCKWKQYNDRKINKKTQQQQHTIDRYVSGTHTRGQKTQKGNKKHELPPGTALIENMTVCNVRYIIGKLRACRKRDRMALNLKLNTQKVLCTRTWQCHDQPFSSRFFANTKPITNQGPFCALCTNQRAFHWANQNDRSPSSQLEKC